MSDQRSVAPVAIKRTKSPDFRVVYTNEFRYRMTPSDLQLSFGALADTGAPPNTLEATEEVLLVMSHGQAKALMEYLNLLVGRYEREIGHIPSQGSPPTEKETDVMFEILKKVGSH